MLNPDLLNTLATITAKKAGFRSLSDGWADTTTLQGRLMLTRSAAPNTAGASDLKQTVHSHTSTLLCGCMGFIRHRRREDMRMATAH